MWLEEYLQEWEKTLVVVSHARAFLNSVVTDILHFQNKDIRRWKGNYDTFEETRSEELRQHERQREAIDRQRAHTQAFIDKFRANAKRASMVQSRVKALGRMAVLSEVLEDPSLQFHFPSPEPLAPPVLQVSDGSFAYAPGQPNIFTEVNLGIDLESRIALVGPNGAGKSTLLKVIYGELEPSSGDVRRSGKLRLGRFAQHHVDGLDLSLTPLEALQRAHPGATNMDIRKHLGKMGLGGNLALQPMRTLSGGQKSRAELATIMWQRPHILLLDECARPRAPAAPRPPRRVRSRQLTRCPGARGARARPGRPTNHLDLDAVEALIHAINEFDVRRAAPTRAIAVLAQASARHLRTAHAVPAPCPRRTGRPAGRQPRRASHHQHVRDALGGGRRQGVRASRGLCVIPQGAARQIQAAPLTRIIRVASSSSRVI